MINGINEWAWHGNWKNKVRKERNMRENKNSLRTSPVTTECTRKERCQKKRLNSYTVVARTYQR